MTSLVFVTQAADPAHPVLGATLPKIRELAARVDEVVVLGDRVVAEAVPANCRVRSFAAPSPLAMRSCKSASVTREPPMTATPAHSWSAVTMTKVSG